MYFFQSHAEEDRRYSTSGAFFAEIGMPTTLAELGFKKADVDKFISTLELNKGSVFGAFRKLTMDDARKIYLSAF